jgi:glycosyltransferase involved in cell wall biosynthesis
MKILFISPVLPVNTRSGACMRTYQLYEDIKSLGEVHFMSANFVGIRYSLLKQFKKNNRYIGHLFYSWKNPILGFGRSQHPKLKELLKESEYDLIFIRYYDTAYKLGALNLKNIFLDCDDCYLEVMRQQHASNEFILKNIVRYIFDKIKSFNYFKKIKNVKHVSFSSHSIFYQGLSNVHIIRNKIAPATIPLSKQAPELTSNILFVGVLNYPPNFEGLDFFIKSIWPEVLRCHPYAKLKIVGIGLPLEFRESWEKIQGINVLGYVEDIVDAYSDISFSIVPVFTGSGTHIKIMESLSLGKTLVISEFAHRGYENTLLHNESLLIAKNKNEFIDHVNALLLNREKCASLAQNGQRIVMEKFVINSSANSFKGIIDFS